jgi:hypothetical protein
MVMIKVSIRVLGKVTGMLKVRFRTRVRFRFLVGLL